MLTNFIICVQAVLPMFLLLAIGYLVRCLKMVNDNELGKMNSLAFKVLFPVLMFNNVYGSDLTQVVSLKLVVFTLASIAAVYIGGTLLTLRIEKTPESRGAMIQAIYRSNFVIMGLPIAINIYGHGNVGVTAIMIAIVVPLFNVLAVSTLEIYRGRSVNYRHIASKIATNPLIIGAIIGIIFVAMGWKLPQILETSAADISSAATIVGIMILGASFNFSSIKKQARNLILCIVIRLIIVPGILLPIALMLGFRDIYFVTLVAIFAAPCALSSYTMAREMESDYELAGNTVVFTSALCCFTMFMWLFIFKTLGAF